MEAERLFLLSKVMCEDLILSEAYTTANAPVRVAVRTTGESKIYQLTSLLSDYKTALRDLITSHYIIYLMICYRGCDEETA